jgi:hypothetical protein
MAHFGDRSEEELTPIVSELIKIVSTKQVCMYVRMYIYVYVYVCICVYVHTCI